MADEDRPEDDGSSPRARGTQGAGRATLVDRRFIPACAGNTRAATTRRRVASVHPRVRGEHDRPTNNQVRLTGSSPRARGTRPRDARRGRHERFIPACAGNTPPGCGRRRGASVHPRVRGEHSTPRVCTTPWCGSSPRARGTPPSPTSCDATTRFIPACAGNTAEELRGAERPAVHPRVRGEHGYSGRRPRAIRGSSPRARGTRAWRTCARRRRRFIPACAGNTSAPTTAPSRRAVHPRVRGEHIAARMATPVFPGSSPRARGTRVAHAIPAGAHRFIPACAGNTRRGRKASGSGSVHPRVRGEHPSTCTGIASADGSSPRARGTLPDLVLVETCDRFIPACAGNTSRRRSARRSATVHPRVRGEHWLAERPPMTRVGSSPRARGTRRAQTHAQVIMRFIPACAGNTRGSCRGTRTRAVHPRVRGEHRPKKAAAR